MADHKRVEALQIDPTKLAVDNQGHVAITDPKVVEMLKGKAGLTHGSDLSKAAVSVGVVVSF
jgi:hypothetical protein